MVRVLDIPGGRGKQPGKVITYSPGTPWSDIMRTMYQTEAAMAFWCGPIQRTVPKAGVIVLRPK